MHSHAHPIHPFRQFMNNHHNLHHSHNQNQTKKCQMLRTQIKYYLEIFDQSISQIISSFDLIIFKMRIHHIFKRVLHGKQILLFCYFLIIQSLLYPVFEKTNSFDSSDCGVKINKLSLYFCLILVCLIHLHFFFFSNNLQLLSDPDLESFLNKRNPQMRKSYCPSCKAIKSMRSYHCHFCNKCINKYNFHSDWFNVCIGNNNELLYVITLLTINFYMVFNLFLQFYYFIFERETLGYFVIEYTLFSPLNLYVIYRTLFFTVDFIKDNVLKNLTIFEMNNFRILTYLKGENHFIFFNPFDKGIKRNLYEIFVNFFDIDLYYDYRERYGKMAEDNETLNKSENDSINTSSSDEFDNINEFSQEGQVVMFKKMIKLSENFRPFISNTGNIYKLTDGKEIINWSHLRLYVIFDLTNSPFREVMLKQANFIIKSQQKQMNNECEQNKCSDLNKDNLTKYNITDKENTIKLQTKSSNDSDKNLKEDEEIVKIDDD